MRSADAGIVGIDEFAFVSAKTSTSKIGSTMDFVIRSRASFLRSTAASTVLPLEIEVRISVDKVEGSCSRRNWSFSKASDIEAISLF